MISAGTSDIPVAEEALLTSRMMGNRAEPLYDVGVAGIHRLLEHRESKLAQARVIICVAGMEGALPSVVGGLVAAPVIAVPTSVGYGASLGGIAALLGMLNSCASNVTVVNIDNGFGAPCVPSCTTPLQRPPSPPPATLNAPAGPIRAPSHVNLMVCARIMPRTSAVCAPSAMRTPISCVLWLTV